MSTVPPLELELSPARSPSATVADFVSLTKPRLSSLVLFTTFGGMWLSGAAVDGWTWLWALLGTAGTVGAANTFNCVLERESDRFMARTAVRPLPARRMDSVPALVFGLVLAVFSLPLLAAGTNVLTGVLGLAALVLYVFVYTPLKSRSHVAMYAGAIPGALPPLMGWTAATGQVEAGGLALFAILFVWQLPHFIAIALFRKAEYQAAGLTSLPLEQGDAISRWYALGFTVLLVPVSVTPVLVGVSSWLYLAGALGLGAYFVREAARGVRTGGDERWARKLFGVSLLYLTALFVVLGVDRALLG